MLNLEMSRSKTMDPLGIITPLIFSPNELNSKVIIISSNDIY